MNEIYEKEGVLHEYKRSRIPTIRIDICFYWIMIIGLMIVLFLSNCEIKRIKAEVKEMNDRIANSAIVDLRQPLK